MKYISYMDLNENSEIHVPCYCCSKGENSEIFLRKLAISGFEEKYLNNENVFRKFVFSDALNSLESVEFFAIGIGILKSNKTRCFLALRAAKSQRQKA